MTFLSKMFATARIFHMASMARSGETIMLRCLNAHSRLRVVHNLNAEDETYETDLFNYLKTYRPKSISRRHRLLRPYQLAENEHLVLKQGVWEHPFQFDGFVLARNPISVYTSLLVYDKDNLESNAGSWQFNQERLVRWMREIDPGLVGELVQLPPMEQFAMFYNRRMGALRKLGCPCFRYEDFVLDPRSTLSRICDLFNVEFEEFMLQSEKMGATATGHGKNDLSKAVNDLSLLKYLKFIQKTDFHRLSGLVGEVASSFGYRLEYGTACI